MSSDSDIQKVAAAVARELEQKGLGLHKHEPAPAAEAPKPEVHHNAPSWSKTCIDCGTPNAKYKKPTHFCKDCGAPIGQKEDAEKAKECYACGGTRVKVKQ